MNTFYRICGLTCLASAVWAQTAPIRQGSFEVGGFTGATYGISNAAPMGGGNVSYAVTKNFLPYVEYSYFPSIEHTITGTIGNSNYRFNATFPASASDFHVGVHYRVPIKETRLAPYGVFGVGVMTIGKGIIKTLNYTDSNGPETLSNLSAPSGGSSAAVNFGGGLRYYMTPQFGTRIEVKGYKPFNTPPQTGLGTATLNNMFLKAEFGFFFQFR